MNDPALAAYSLMHGRVTHGLQFRAEESRRTPTVYYGPTSGVGIAIRQANTEATSRGQKNLRIGVVGLGVGTLAAYGRPGDTLDFYELNPDVIRIANDPRYFTFLSDSEAQIAVIPGDARLSLERSLEKNEREDFDVFVVDAFSGDAIPVHLLTVEAFEIYQGHLRRPSGILAVHISNAYLDLRPVVLASASKLGLKAMFVHSQGDGRITRPSDWMVLSEDNLPRLSSTEQQASGDAHIPAIAPWTDDYSNLIRIIKH